MMTKNPQLLPAFAALQDENFKVEQMDLSFVWLKLTDAMLRDSPPKSVYVRWEHISYIGVDRWENLPGSDEPRYMTCLNMLNGGSVDVVESPTRIFEMVQEEINKMINIFHPFMAKEAEK